MLSSSCKARVAQHHALQHASTPRNHSAYPCTTTSSLPPLPCTITTSHSHSPPPPPPPQLAINPTITHHHPTITHHHHHNTLLSSFTCLPKTRVRSGPRRSTVPRRLLGPGGPVLGVGMAGGPFILH
ncbi:hypothetical protein E2C01_058997 [Portunus trituberculatus]|uniref:Uncharacterized protein n=1 Tax=Portunus trituberculatus TaxID=210409 RepID=A0A5B7H5M7_PORTR|nr:hypothetical protein [Portunus trituberculatus]